MTHGVRTFIAWSTHLDGAVMDATRELETWLARYGVQDDMGRTPYMLSTVAVLEQPNQSHFNAVWCYAIHLIGPVPNDAT